MKKNNSSFRTAAVGLSALLLSGGCSEDPTSIGQSFSLGEDSQCSIPQSLILSGGPGKDGIPALSDPDLVAPGDPGVEYLRDDDRVVGLLLESGPLAIPLNIFWWHEIVNLNATNPTLAITHCPLTGSSLGFDRAGADGAEFGVSGLLFQNNLIMYDRNGVESLWPQMLRGARCGARDGTDLSMVPIMEMTWEGWRSLHPRTLVVSDNTGFPRGYAIYPYGNYDDLNNPRTLFPSTVDGRRPPKERVLGIPRGVGGMAFPFGLLDEAGTVAAISFSLSGESMAVFWNRVGEAAMAYEAVLDDQELTFSVKDGQIQDDQTGSTWRVDGLATSGPLAGHRLQPEADAFVAYWFAWPEFYPEIEIWSGGP